MDPYETIDTQKARDLVNEGNLTIVDIRSPDDFEQGHIEHAISVNDTNIDEFIDNADKNKPILCYCYMGFSSQSAAQYFKDQGFKTVYSMEGGYTKWQRDFESADEA